MTSSGEKQAEECKEYISGEWAQVRKSIERALTNLSAIRIYPELAHRMDAIKQTITPLFEHLKIAFDTYGMASSLQVQNTVRVLANVDGLHTGFSTAAQLGHLTTLNDTIRRIARSLLTTQEQYRRVLGQMGTIPNIGVLAARNSVLAASAFENIQAVAAAAHSRKVNLDNLLYTGLGDQLTQVTSSYDSLLRLKIADPLNISSEYLAQKTWRDMTIPSAALANYTQAIRLGAGYQESEVLSEDLPINARQPNDELDHLLKELSLDFANIRRGSREALDSDNPDKLRHAAASYRELIRMVLATLIPDVKINENHPCSKMKRRIQQILEGSEVAADFALAVSEAVYSLYIWLSKPVHTTYRKEGALRAALLVGDGFLLFLLSHRYK